MANSSAPLAERVNDLPSPDYTEGAGQSPNFLITVLRRWPLVLLGIIGGIIFGLAYYAQSAPVYESRAQVLVIKRGLGGIIGGDSARFSYMEDYVSTQQTLLKSKKVMKAAALRLREIKLNQPLSDDPDIRTDSLIGGVTVSRDKESGGGVVGSNVLNLTFRSGDNGDTRKILETVITAYQEELKTVYDQQTTDEIKNTTHLKDNSLNERNQKSEERTKLDTKMMEITSIRQADLQVHLNNKTSQSDQLDQTNLPSEISIEGTHRSAERSGPASPCVDEGVGPNAKSNGLQLVER